MARQCDTKKYKKRRARERQNAKERTARLQRIEAEWREEARKREAARKAAWLADPRRQWEQRLVNVLYARLCSNPLYQVMQIGEAFGIDSEALKLKQQLEDAISV